MRDTDIIDDITTGDGRARIRSRRRAIAGRRRPPPGPCECGRPAIGPGAARCDECGAGICPACAAEPGGGTCWPCVVRALAAEPPTEAEAAEAMELVCAALRDAERSARAELVEMARDAVA